MKVETTALPGMLVLSMERHADDRGFVMEAWRRDTFARLGIHVDFDQDNLTGSYGGTLRGLHYQLSPPQGKLVRCVVGAIYDVAIDLRRSSPHFGRHAAVTLTAGDGRAVWIPPGFAHGFYALGEWTEVLYKMSGPRDVASERVIRWDAAGVEWPAAPRILSPRDCAGVALADADVFP